MRIAITGRNGQVAQSLLERAAIAALDVSTIARPGVDLTRPNEVEAALVALAPQVVVNAAAYTAVDLAESEPDLAYAVNVEGAAAVARTASRLGIPIIHLSTDYVFDGTLDRPYCESDATGPLGVYGQTKLEGERAIISASDNHAILRTAWVYSPFGKNFARTMLSLASKRDEISVVSDQLGSPTNALDIVNGIIAVAENLVQKPSAAELRGVFHMTGAGETTWAGFAEAVFDVSAAAGGPSAHVKPIPMSSYPTPAKRPANSRLDNSKLFKVHGVHLPDWRQSLPDTVERLLMQDFPKT
ncbi:dTDP-4-dehydrorhamnose reductase [Rhodopseudomonas boonkerdii]|uniref:dTDP-4-dehydrorhamnose reductase n=1 Tax=Rhodopseudomonas boonkerdii TaxID=475937 RepID=UPI001E36350B|nr:dTDP-4-dehydrorhamnose reductase [Rhodopseudomonas boonkerdii]UGV25844.1 dTDP-4-dehydrorhamnose reductase [Rhodopseudomonas boonkerdii]